MLRHNTMFNMSLPSIKVSRIIQAAPEKVWDMLTDTTRWTEWGPTVRAVQSETRYIEAGSTGYVKTVFGFWAPFAITEWTHQQYWSWRVFNIRATGHRIEIINADCCRLIFEVPLWAAPYAVICQIAADRIGRILKAGDSPD
ncbi:MAG: SRPBCC family protein [Desulfobacterales bacterium]